MQLSEKDAEIIKLGMYLGDEKKKFQAFVRKTSQKSLLNNASSSSLIRRSADTSQINFGEQKSTDEHTEALTSENTGLKKQSKELITKLSRQSKEVEELKKE